MKTLRLAVAQYALTPPIDWASYCAHLTTWADTAVANGAQLLVLPEYCSAELIALAPPAARISLAQQLTYLQHWREPFLLLLQQLAITRQVYIAAGSYPVRIDNAHCVNRADWLQPDGTIAYQDKLHLTRFERETGLIITGDALRVFNTPHGCFAINICYDCEFPLLARRLAERGVELLIVPSCTNTIASYQRVRISCQARALENQFYVAQAVMVGANDWSALVDEHYGAAGVFTPIDDRFPDNGVLALGEYDQPQWVYSTINLDAIAQVRRDGQVCNYDDWNEWVAVE